MAGGIKGFVRKGIQETSDILKTGGTLAVDSAKKVQESGMLGNAINVGLPLYFGASEYQRARNEGEGIAMSGARAVGDFAMGEMLGFKGYLALSAASAIPSGVSGVINGLNSMSRNMNRAAVSGPFSTAMFQDTQQNATMRQAGMQMAQASKYNLSQALMGNEAQYMRL